jgi:hypothetical protein
MTSKGTQGKVSKAKAATPAAVEPATGPEAVPGLLGAVHRELRRGSRRREIERALRHPDERALEPKG